MSLKIISLFLLRNTSSGNTLPWRSEWWSSLPPDCFVSRGIISPCEYFLTFFHGEALLAPRPTPKLEDHPSSAVRDGLFNIFAATLHIRSRSSSATWGRAVPWWQGPTYRGCRHIRNVIIQTAVDTGTEGRYSVTLSVSDAQGPLVKWARLFGV